MVAVNGRSRNWCFTHNNPPEYEDIDVQSWPMQVVCNYVIFQIEQGENGTKHYQGFVMFSEAKGLARVKMYCNEAHWEIMKGTAMQAMEYCKKSSTKIAGPWEKGRAPKQGKRSDLIALCDGIKKGDPIPKLWDEHLPTIMKYTKGFDRAVAHFTERKLPSWRKVLVTVYWGATGVGKTRRVVEKEKDLYIVDLDNWFDGYTNQKAILFDDFYGQQKASQLLRILDGYKRQQQIKGASVWGQWERVYFTSNCPPEKWYTRELSVEVGGGEQSSIPVEVRAALMRRINIIKEIKRGDIDNYVVIN